MPAENDQFDFNDRYGITPARAWVKYAAGFAIVGGGWLLWAGLHQANPALRYELIAFSNTDPRNPEIRFLVERADGAQEVQCTLVARDYEKNVVGQIDITIAAGETYLEPTYVVPTRADAVNVGISRCRTLP
jgi:hypothetical protein